MKKFITLFSLSLLISAHMFSSQGGRLVVNPEVQDLIARAAQQLVVLEQRRLTDHDTRVAHVQGATSAHAASRALCRVGDMYVAGGRDLSPEERFALAQAGFVSKASLAATVVAAAAGRGDVAQIAAWLGIGTSVLSMGYTFWRGHRRLTRQ